MIWIAVDAMGGDFAPRPVVDGALAAARHFDLGVALVGRRANLDAELERHDLDPERVVGRLMEIVLESAGAQRGVLLLREGEDLSIVARLSVEGRLRDG